MRARSRLGSQNVVTFFDKITVAIISGDRPILLLKIIADLSAVSRLRASFWWVCTQAFICCLIHLDVAFVVAPLGPRIQFLQQKETLPGSTYLCPIRSILFVTPWNKVV